MDKKPETVPANVPQVIPRVNTSVFVDIKSFEEGQRIAGELIQSSMVPEQFKKNVADCLVAVDIGRNMNVSPWAIVQNMYVIDGRPGFSASFLISLIAGCGRFVDHWFEYEGEGLDRACTMFVVSRRTGKVHTSTTVSCRMAKEEGWAARNAKKWRNMTDQMLAYRAATFFARLYCPDLMWGVQTVEELEDVHGAYTTQPGAGGGNWEKWNDKEGGIETGDPVDDLNKRFSGDAPETTKKQGEAND